MLPHPGTVMCSGWPCFRAMQHKPVSGRTALLPQGEAEGSPHKPGLLSSLSVEGFGSPSFLL